MKILYETILVFTGYGRLTASTTTGRLVSVIYTLFSTPIFFLLILELAQLAVALTILAAKYWAQEEGSEEERERKAKKVMRFL